MARRLILFVGIGQPGLDRPKGPLETAPWRDPAIILLASPRAPLPVPSLPCKARREAPSSLKSERGATSAAPNSAS
jgi:hypothetical protein